MVILLKAGVVVPFSSGPSLEELDLRNGFSTLMKNCGGESLNVSQA